VKRSRAAPPGKFKWRKSGARRRKRHICGTCATYPFRGGGGAVAHSAQRDRCNAIRSITGTANLEEQDQ
jgi:hypothetical protein